MAQSQIKIYKSTEVQIYEEQNAMSQIDEKKMEHVESKQSFAQSPRSKRLQKLGVKINRKLFQFTIELDDKSSQQGPAKTADKPFIQHVNLDDSWFISESKINSHVLKQQRFFRKLAEVQPIETHSMPMQADEVQAHEYQKNESQLDIINENQITQQETVESIEPMLQKICGGFLDDLEKNSVSDNSSDDEKNSIDLKNFENFKLMSNSLSTGAKLSTNDKDDCKIQSDKEDSDDDDVDDDVFGNFADNNIGFGIGKDGKGYDEKYKYFNKSSQIQRARKPHIKKPESKVKDVDADKVDASNDDDLITLSKQQTMIFQEQSKNNEEENNQQSNQ